MSKLVSNVTAASKTLHVRPYKLRRKLRKAGMMAPYPKPDKLVKKYRALSH